MLLFAELDWIRNERGKKEKSSSPKSSCCWHLMKCTRHKLHLTPHCSYFNRKTVDGFSSKNQVKGGETWRKNCSFRWSSESKMEETGRICTERNFLKKKDNSSPGLARGFPSCFLPSFHSFFAIPLPSVTSSLFVNGWQGQMSVEAQPPDDWTASKSTFSPG